MLFVERLFLLYFIVAVHSSNKILRSNNVFSSNLYNALDTSDRNVVYSPLSVHTLLTLLYEGSARNTEASLRNVLRLPKNKDRTADQYRDILKSLGGETNLTIEIANKVYVRDSFQLKQKFKDVARDSFFAESESLNMDNARGAADEVNGWVEKKTHGKISQLLDANDFDRYTRSVLLNAIYFKGEWAAKFDKKETTAEPFYVSPTETVNCSMMHRLDYFYYVEDHNLNAQVLKLKFSDQRFNLLVILPREKTGITNLEEAMATANLTNLRESLTGTEVNVYLPRFKIESKYELKKPLTDLGLGEIFADDAEFPNIVDNDENLTVSKIIQKATIEINEEGGEASAATGVIIAVPISAIYRPPPPEIFKADHPFVFLLTATLEGRENEARYGRDVILFMGKVTTPVTSV